MAKGKIVTFMGSPRKSGYTAKLVAEIARGAKDAGLEVVGYDLNEEGIRGCQSCMACRGEGKDECVLRDPLQSMYADMRDAVGIVVGSPIYFYQVTAQTLLWINRTYPFIEMAATGPKARHAGKKAVTVFAQGNPVEDSFKEGKQFVKDVLEGPFGWKVTESLTCAGMPAEDSPAFKQLMERAYQAGQAFANS